MRFNMDRGLWPEAVLAGITTLTVAWPLTKLLEEGTWIGPAILMVVLVAVVGAVLRSFDLEPALIVLAQALSVLAALTWRYLSDTLMWAVVPGPDTLERAAELLREAGRTLQAYAAPAPTNEGVEFLIVAVLALTAVSVDAIGVTGRAPATAGLPLAAAFLVSISNSGESMEPWFFAAAGLAWLLMVAQQGNRLVLGWSSADRRESRGSEDVSQGPSGHRTTARLLAAATVLAALIGASALPHLPPTFLADGLARNPDGNSLGGTGQVSFTETMDVTADLHDQSNEPVIRFRSTATTLPPLRVTASTDYEDGSWATPDYDLGPPESGLVRLPGPAEQINADVNTRTDVLTVISNGMRPPHLAVPAPVASIEADGARVQWDQELSAARVSDPVDSYDVNFLQVAPGGNVPDEIGAREADPQAFAEYLALDPASEEAIRELTEQVVGDTTNDLQVASLLQQHFRSGQYAYNLQLAPPTGADPITHFLQTRQGYCVQFATAMVMAARAEGIPARMALGFLPGERQANGSYAVLASDAHTWPELWIDGLGWTRFEPTPGIRTGPAPSYSQGESVTAEADPTMTSNATPTETATQEPTTTQDEQSWWDGLVDALRNAWPIVLRALIVVAAIALLMALIALAGRRHREALLRSADNPQERIEGQWELLKRSLEDLGIDPPAERSPAQMGAHYAQKARLDKPGGEALGRATATLERARYAAPERTVDSDDSAMHRDVLTVLDSVSNSLPWNIRASAKLFPRSGVHYLRASARDLFSRR